MSDAMITIVSGEVVDTTSDGRPLAPRRLGDAAKAVRITERSVEEVKANLSRFVSQVSEMLDAARSEIEGYVLETVEVAAEITGEGKVGFMGTGVNLGGSTSLKIVFRKKQVPPGVA
jgi:hypothetical protein